MKGVLKARRCPVTAGKVVLRGTLMAAAGLSPDDPVRVVRYDDAVVVEACAVVDMDGLVRKENGGRPVVTLTLMGSALENTAHVLALAAKGRVVLAMMADNLEPSAADGTPQPEQPAPEPLANVRRYLVPEGKRLQLQGRWLIQYGFDAGAKYEVHVTGDKVRIELAESGKATVTRYSDTASKLYVPAASLTALAGKEVLVRARKGHLELVTA